MNNAAHWRSFCPATGAGLLKRITALLGFMRVTRKVVAAVACTCAALALSTGVAQAAANCSISPTSPTIDAGQSVQFSGNVTGRPPATYAWNFNCTAAQCDPTTADTETVTVTYNIAGSYVARLDGENSKGDTCFAETTVTVNQAGNCVYNDPTFSMGADQSIIPDGSAVYTLSVTNNDTAACPDSTFTIGNLTEVGDTGSFVQPSVLSGTSVTIAPGAIDTTVTLTVEGNGTGLAGDNLTSTVTISDSPNHQDQSDSVTTTIVEAGPTARGDSYTTPRNRSLDVVATRLSGVLYNDFDENGDPLVAANEVSGTSNGNLTLNADGSFSYTPDNDFQGDDQFTYQGEDSQGKLTDVVTVNIRVLPDQPDFKFMMNYELGMHCTGFEFAYCCVLPAYNSIVAQIAKRDNGLDWPHLLEGDPNLGRNLDVLGRETVVRSPELDGPNGFQKYVVKYWHDAQSRNDGQGKPQEPGTTIPGLPGYLNSSTLISDAESHTLLAWNTRADAAAEDGNNKLILGSDPFQRGDGCGPGRW